jgi:TolA-binding protein
MMELQPWQAFLALLGTAGGSSGITAFFNYLGQRGKDRTIARSDVEKAARELIETALSSAKVQVERLQEEVDRLQHEVNALRGETDRLKAQHADCEEGQRKLREEIDRLMQVAPADYKPADLKRVRRA